MKTLKFYQLQYHYSSLLNSEFVILKSVVLKFIFILFSVKYQ